MKYTWKAYSNDGSYENASGRKFNTKMDAYNDMRACALEKMKWNTEWEDFADMDERDYIGYSVKFHPDYIIHESYSGIYTYEIVEIPDSVHIYGRTWDIIKSYTPEDLKDWEVCEIAGVGKMWMNNYEGFIVIIAPDGTILKSDI